MTTATVNGVEPTMLGDLIQAQNAMPGLQKTAINPHFGNRYVPLEELIEKVLPVLNAHGFVLMQLPTTLDGHPALETRLTHRSGETISGTMLLLCAKDDPQGQGSAITYARRYSLMSLLGLSADQDDDAERSHQSIQRTEKPAFARPPQAQVNVARQRVAESSHINERDDIDEVPECPDHGPLKFIKAGTSQNGKPYSAFWGCRRDCTAGRQGRSFSQDAGSWFAAHMLNPPAVEYDPDEVPVE